MRGKLSPVVRSVSNQVVNDVYHAGMIFFAAPPPEVDDLIQSRGNQPLEGPSVHFKTPEKLLAGYHIEYCLCLLRARYPFEPDPFADHHMTERFWIHVMRPFQWPGASRHVPLPRRSPALRR